LVEVSSFPYSTLKREVRVCVCVCACVRACVFVRGTDGSYFSMTMDQEFELFEYYISRMRFSLHKNIRHKKWLFLHNKIGPCIHFFKTTRHKNMVKCTALFFFTLFARVVVRVCVYECMLQSKWSYITVKRLMLSCFVLTLGCTAQIKTKTITIYFCMAKVFARVIFCRLIFLYIHTFDL